MYWKLSMEMTSMIGQTTRVGSSLTRSNIGSWSTNKRSSSAQVVEHLSWVPKVRGSNASVAFLLFRAVTMQLSSWSDAKSGIAPLFNGNHSELIIKSKY